MHNQVCVGLLLVFVVTLNNKLLANDQPSQAVPFGVNGELPIMRGAGLPQSMPARLLNAGQWQLDVQGELQSNAIDAGSSSAGESLIIDGETSQLDVGLSYAMSARWQVNVQTDYVRHATGHLDHAIDQWHELFGLSEGDRALFEEDQLLFKYQAEQQEKATLERPADGFGDVTLGLAYQLYDNVKGAASLRMGVNWPTGGGKLLGSDKLDFTISGHFSGVGVAQISSLFWHANIGYLHIGDEFLFSIPVQQDVLFSSLGLYWQRGHRWQWKLQLDAHSALFESDIDELDQAALQLTAGFNYQRQVNHTLEWYFAEDLTVNRAPDFTIGVRSRWHF